MKKREKQPYEDDGHTVYNMENVPRAFGREAQPKEKKEKPELNKRERFAAIKAAFQVYFPKLLLVIACFSVVAILLYLWLK